MILSDLKIMSKVHLQCEFSGIDSLEYCLNKEHFCNYPHKVDYVYNSRGFRDAEWPESQEELKNAIWCIGDSFTVGIGSPYNFTWPQMLSIATGRRCINVSMDGASNDWISRRAQQIIKEVAPTHMVVLWSYINRREFSDITWFKFLTDKKTTVQPLEDLKNIENFSKNWLNSYKQIKDSSWPNCATIDDWNLLPEQIRSECELIHKFSPDLISDEDRRIWTTTATHMEDFTNFVWCYQQLNDTGISTNIYNSTIPKYSHIDQDRLQDLWNNIRAPSWPILYPQRRSEFATLPDHVQKKLFAQAEIKSNFELMFAQVEFVDHNDLLHLSNLDYARDYKHFGDLTSKFLIETICNSLFFSQQSS